MASLFDIAGLIANDKIVGPIQVDPNNTYFQIGIWNPTSRPKAGDKPYEDAVIPLSSLLSGGGVYSGDGTTINLNPGNIFSFVSTNISQFINDSGYSAAVPITNNVIPKGTGASITDGSWEFSVNDLIPTTTGSNIGDATHRIGTIFMASTINYASDLIWDSTGERMRLTTGGNLGIGLTNPTARLHTKGVDATSGSFAFKAQNISGGELLAVRNDGFIGIGTLSPNPFDPSTVQVGATGGTSTMNFNGGGGNGATLSVRGHQSVGRIFEVYNNNFATGNSRLFINSTQNGDGVGTTGYVELMLHVGTVATLTLYDYNNTNPRAGFGAHVAGDAALISSRNDIESVGSDAFMQWTNTLSSIAFDSTKGLGYASPFLYMATHDGVSVIGSVKISSFGDSYLNGGKVSMTLLPTSNAGLSTGDLYVDTAANILSNGDLVVGWKV